MDLYLGNCRKAAKAAVTKAAACSRTAGTQQCNLAKYPTPEVGAADLLDLTLVIKLPVIQGSNNVFYTTNKPGDAGTLVHEAEE
ncbi:fibrous sheath-interacting protein 2-like [Manis javanica]|uniref:fibrous sheath-interacting protein 2-like n=1 Tax=Manis javanica TaxID=9974 RepID=UPI003C6D789A